MDASVLIPVKDGMRNLPESIRALGGQRDVSFEIIATDSGSRDGSADFLRRCGACVHEIRPDEFHHARTRNLLASLARGRYLVFLTQDATPAEPRWLANLIAPFLSDDRLAGTFSRHIPRSNCRLPLARLMRYEWPQQGGTHPVVKEYLDEEDFRARHEELVYFSDTSSCIARSVWEVHPLPEVEFGEDRCWAEQVLRAGWRLRYTPESAVWHSHDYGLKRQFMQNVDYGRFLRDMPWASGFGARRALAEAADLLRRDYGYLRAHRLPRSLIARCVAWYLATFAGRCAGWYHDRWPWRSLAAFSLQATLRRRGAKGCP